ncbi:hypothetical protein PDESU_05080 [Pontiella desulfatans]|uniref:YbjN domain-containing protein n=1 Tax=Pontiella desulfatans TaxID=2750659 RepID=A0A6C2U9C1_PONDE|nr:hypothetical protein [Pontiella desulfatans]VGO16489.1 hypothetical protein PDESU_05080 [Pontiella desulfatans]
MVDKIETLEQVAGVLESQGYDARLVSGEAVMVDVGGSEHPFAAVVTKNDNGAEFVLTCQLATLGDIEEDLSAQFMLAALDANTAIRPFAFAVISDTDDPALAEPEQWPVVLTSSIPVGDLSEGELCVAMDGLWSALTAAAPVLKLGITK